MNRYLALGAGVSLMLALTGCANRAAQEQAKRTQTIVGDTTIPVVLAQATSMDMQESVTLTGSLVSSEDATIGAAMPGRIVAVYVRDGDPVSAGKVLAKQDSVDIEHRVEQARAQVMVARANLMSTLADAKTGPDKSSSGVKAAEAQLAQAKSQLLKLKNGARTEERKQAEAQLSAAKKNLETAQLSYNRVKKLYEEGALTKNDLERADAALAGAQAQFEAATETVNITLNFARPEDLETAQQAVKAAQENLKVSQANKYMDVVFKDRIDGAKAAVMLAEENLASARKSLSDTVIRAPFGGRINGKPVQVGTYLSPGNMFCKIVGGSGIYFDADVPESAITKISVGARVDVNVSALGAKTFIGTVSAINPQASAVARQFSIRIHIIGDQEGLKPGMFARGKVELGLKRGAIVVPSVAILRDGEKSFVFSSENGTAKKIEVKLGLDADGKTQVEGVPVGTQIVVQGQSKLVDGVKLQVETADKTAKPEDAQGAKQGA